MTYHILHTQSEPLYGLTDNGTANKWHSSSKPEF